ncbi:MAG: hypothetical protein JW780_05945 [Clostridiales bacterium]|nr:hypothetical protein [Clostridiales bacterium]
MENVESKRNSGKRKWVITTAVVFVVIIFLLTFFSNTIMNYSLPKVSAQYASYGIISTSNKSVGVIEAAVTVEVDAFDTRKIQEVLVYPYSEVQKGDILLLLEPITESEELDMLKDQLEEMELQRHYDEMLPDDTTDYTYMEDAIEDAISALSAAKTDLSNSKNKDTIIANAQSEIDRANASIITLTSEIDALSAVKVDLEQDLIAARDDLSQAVDDAAGNYSQELDDAFAAFQLALETSGPDITDAIESLRQALESAVQVLEQEWADEIELLEQQLAAAQDDLDAVPEGDDDSAEQAEVDRLTNEIIQANDDYSALIAEVSALFQAELAEAERLIEEIAGIDRQLAEKADEMVAEQSKLADAEEILFEAESYLSVTDAEKAVSRAEKSLSDARKALSDQKKIDAVAREQEKRRIEKEDEQMEELRVQISDIEENMKKTEIRAPISGQPIGFNFNPGDEIMKDQNLGTIIDLNGGYKADFTFTTQQARMMYVGMELLANQYDAERVVVTNIRPDPADPRNSRIVTATVSGEYLWVDSQIEVRFDDYSQSFECVVPNSSIHEDGSGRFVYLLNKKSGPLGDRYTASKVNIEVLATDGKVSALEPSAVMGRQVIVRSEKPLANGDQVRLEYFTQEE